MNAVREPSLTARYASPRSRGNLEPGHPGTARRAPDPGPLRKLLALLSRAERQQLLGSGGVVVGMGVLEVAGIASIIPFMAVVANPSVIQTSPQLFASQDSDRHRTSCDDAQGMRRDPHDVGRAVHRARHLRGAPGSQPYVPVHGEGSSTSVLARG